MPEVPNAAVVVRYSNATFAEVNKAFFILLITILQNSDKLFSLGSFLNAEKNGIICILYSALSAETHK